MSFKQSARSFKEDPNKKRNYIIVKTSFMLELESKVEEKMKEGYELYGFPFTFRQKDGFDEVCQSMILKQV